ncbi:MAG: LytTR family DNA-binding domain-containing protein, partial [Lachnospiraceae bacterium]|nr:LytTR family DNA-binding domain-containing protein [Lachnospiraceae bacterium]
MIRIGICDDQEVFRRQIAECCSKYFETCPSEFEFIEFASGGEVLAYDGEQIQLLFLDVELGDTDGISVLQKLQRTDTIRRVVFVTSHDEVMIDAFSTKTLGFLIKPVTEREVEKYILKVLQEEQENIPMEFCTNRILFTRLLEEVLYLEGKGNYAYLHTEKETILLDGKLKVWQEKMQEAPMIRIHKSYIV